MIITLNSDPFDVTIENEKTLEELYTGISNWLIKSDLEITELVKDGEDLKLTNSSEWKNILLENIGKLDIVAISGSDRYISDLQTLYQYISLLQNAVTGSNNALISDLLSELKYVTSTLDSFLSKKDLPIYGTLKLKECINNFQKENREELESRNKLIELLKNISLVLQMRIKEVTSPFSELQKTAELLKKIIPGISDVSVMLQTGDDQQAINSILTFIDLSEKLIRLFPFLKEFGYTDISTKSIDSESFDDFYKGFNSILVELIDAFDINDSILIGDLMEYEIAPRVNKLLEFINLIEKVKE